MARPTSITAHTSFMRLWAGNAVSNVGDGVQRIAVLWWTATATGSATAVGAVALASVIPILLASPLAGALVDRHDRRTVMIVADATRVVSTMSLVCLHWGGALQVWHVVALTAVAATASSAFDPAFMSSITLVVPDEQRARANAMVGANNAVAGIAGPALGGLLVALGGTGLALAFDAATFLVSLAFVASCVLPRPGRAAEGSDSADDGILAGLRVVRRHRGIRDLVTAAAGLNVFVAPLPVLLVSLATGPFHLGGGGYGLLAACIPAGVLIGLAMAPQVADRAPAGVAALLLTSIAFGVSAIWGVAFAMVAFLAAGVGVGVVNTVLPTRFQSEVDPAVQGRVFAIVGAASQVGRPLGLAVAAPLITAVGVRGGFVFCGVGLCLVTLAARRGLSGRAPADRPLVAPDDSVASPVLSAS